MSITVNGESSAVVLDLTSDAVVDAVVSAISISEYISTDIKIPGVEVSGDNGITWNDNIAFSLGAGGTKTLKFRHNANIVTTTNTDTTFDIDGSNTVVVTPSIDAPDMNLTSDETKDLTVANKNTSTENIIFENSVAGVEWSDDGGSNWYDVNDSFSLESANLVKEYAQSLGLVTNAYYGGCYCATLDRIYLAPYAQSTRPTWHYIDCTDGSLQTYTHGASSLSANAYSGAVHDPIKDRIYFIPDGQSANSTWHYLDCSDGTIHGYTHGATVVQSGYYGACYESDQDRIYLVPLRMGPHSNWHYIDCTTGNVVAYAHGTGITTIRSYAGTASFDSVNHKIYFAPYDQGPQTQWHYINTLTGAIVPYTHGATVINQPYWGTVFDSNNNRTYFVPSKQAPESTWHYVTGSTNTVSGYVHLGTGLVTSAYSAGYYDPISKRIYLSPWSQTNQTNWHYVDVETNTATTYNKGVTISAGIYSYIVLSPNQERLYLMPLSRTSSPTWHFLDIGLIDSSKTYKFRHLDPQIISTNSEIYINFAGTNDKNVTPIIDSPDLDLTDSATKNITAENLDTSSETFTVVNSVSGVEWSEDGGSIWNTGNAGPFEIEPATDFYYILDQTNKRIVKRKRSDMSYVDELDITSLYSGFIYPCLCSDDEHIWLTNKLGDEYIKFTKDLVYVSRYGTTGSGDDQFEDPIGITVDNQYLYISDQTNDRIVKRLKSDNSYVAKYGTSGSGNDNLSTPEDVAVDELYIYIADYDNDRIVKRLKSDLSYVDQYGSSGTGDNNLDGPLSVAVDETHLYVADVGNARIVKRLKSDLSYVDQDGSYGTGDSQFDTIRFIEVDDTHIYATDMGLNRVVKRFKSNLSYVSKIGTSGSGDDQFITPKGICCDNNLFGFWSRQSKELSFRYDSSTATFSVPSEISYSGTNDVDLYAEVKPEGSIGDVQVNKYSTPITYRIENIDTSTRTITSIVAPTGFEVKKSEDEEWLSIITTFDILTGQYQDFDIRVIPTSTIRFSGDVNLTYNPTITFELTGTGIPSTISFTDYEFETATMFANTKTQKNPYTDVITEYGVSGDIAGLLISKMNDGNFYDVIGSNNSSIKNILSIDEFTYDETIELQNNYKNIIQRQGTDYYMYGNTTSETDQTKMLSNFNLMVIKLFMEKQIVKFLDTMISENFTDETTLDFIDSKMSDIKNSVKKYLRDFDYRIDYNVNSKLIDVIIWESFDKPISKINIDIVNATVKTV